MPCNKSRVNVLKPQFIILFTFSKPFTISISHSCYWGHLLSNWITSSCLQIQGKVVGTFQYKIIPPLPDLQVPDQTNFKIRIINCSYSLRNLQHCCKFTVKKMKILLNGRWQLSTNTVLCQYNIYIYDTLRLFLQMLLGEIAVEIYVWIK